MRISIGPSCGGFTCNLALLRLLSTIQDTRSARPSENSGVSTPAFTFTVTGGVGSAEPAAVADALNCAAPAEASLSGPVATGAASPVSAPARLSSTPVFRVVATAGTNAEVSADWTMDV